ncbi:MAG: protein kinase [Bacteroidetes bacterium]|nr:protein kinase [Bacteroidota bacterium]
MKLNQYEWDPENDVIGYGAFAEVFRAKDNNGHYAALKIYREAITKGSTGGVFQSKYTLEEEYKKGELLAHTNVIRYINLDYIVHVDSMQRTVSYPVLIMEYADAGNLSDWLKSTTPPTVAEAEHIIREILDGLTYLHSQGIIHRDLKPGNILFKKDRMGNRVVKISDFGISRDTLQDSTNRPSATAGVGTIDYMAPEQLMKKTYGLDGEVSNRTDLWAAGVILYRMLTGKMPFGEENKDYENIHSEIISKEPDYSKVPAKYQSVIKACMQKHASQRPANADAVIEILDKPEKKIPPSDDREKTDFLDDNRFKKQPKPVPVPVPVKSSPIGKYIAMAAAAVLVIVLGVKFLHGNTQQVTNMLLRDSSNKEYTYTGTVKDGKPEGTGRATYTASKMIYAGDFENGKPEGKDTIFYANQSKYIGDVKNYVPEGKGVCNYYDNSKYDGDWKNGQLDGTGTYNYTNGAVYKGEWRNNKRSGKGTYNKPNGMSYDGDWSNDYWDGQGTLVKENGDKYVGDFKEGYMDGNGTYWINRNDVNKGDKYTGAFAKDQYLGMGTYWWTNGDVYVGYWKDSKRDGDGTMTYQDGGKYVGKWLNDQKSGPGVYTKDGVSYNEVWLFGQKLSSTQM